jgi:hypothetical protein
MKKEKITKQEKEKTVEECPAFGKGYDAEVEECQLCAKDFPTDFQKCKELTLGTKKTEKKGENTKQVVEKVKSEGTKVEKTKVTKTTKKEKKSSAESKTLQYVANKVTQGRYLKGTAEQKILAMFSRGLGKRIVPLLKKGVQYGDWYRIVHWPERTIMDKLELVKYIDKGGKKIVTLSK